MEGRGSYMLYPFSFAQQQIWHVLHDKTLFFPQERVNWGKDLSESVQNQSKTLASN